MCEGDLVLGAAAPPFKFEINGGNLQTFDTDTDALDNLALGDGVRCDAAISAQQTIQAFIDDGGPIKLVGDPLYYEPLAIAFDKNDPADAQSLSDAVEPDRGRHARGRHPVRAVEEVVQRRRLDDRLRRGRPVEHAFLIPTGT